MSTKRRPPLGQYIHDERTRQGLTMRQAADAAGTSQAYWSQIENGTVKLPGADLRRRIAAALGVRHVDLLIAAGELTEGEAGPAAPPTDADLAALHRDIEPYLRVFAGDVANSRALLQVIEVFAGNVRAARGMAPTEEPPSAQLVGAGPSPSPHRP